MFCNVDEIALKVGLPPSGHESTHTSSTMGKYLGCVQNKSPPSVGSSVWLRKHLGSRRPGRVFVCCKSTLRGVVSLRSNLNDMLTI